MTPAPRPTAVCPSSKACEQLLCDQVWIPGGAFPMGSNQAEGGASPNDFGGLDRLGDPRPLHTVHTTPFCIDKYEVTVERYESCVQAGFCDPGRENAQFSTAADSFQTHVNHYPDYCMERGERCPTCAVNCRSFEQAEAYCAWIGRRLCTEAEWERAASGPGPTKRRFPWGEEPPDALLANVGGEGPGYVLPSDALPAGASAEGVFNLSGNVFEWVEGPYALYLDFGATSLSPTEGVSLRLGRGGCFHTSTGYRTFDRTTFHPEFNWGCIGIRCCADPVPPDEAKATTLSKRISLPAVADGPESAAFERLLRARRSTRVFDDGGLSLQETSRLLFAGQGIARSDGGRTTPSAGALYPLELFLVASRVEGLEAGIYRYEPHQAALSLLANGAFSEALRRAALSQSSIAAAPAVIVILGVFERTAVKYGDRAERYVFLEAGHSAQNILLQAAALDLGAVPIGAFDDVGVKRILKTAAAPLYLIPVGRKPK